MIGRRIVYKAARTGRNRWESMLHGSRVDGRLCLVDRERRQQRPHRKGGEGRCPWVARIARPESREGHERKPGQLRCVPAAKSYLVSWGDHYYQESFHHRRLGRAPASVAGHRLKAWRYPDIGF